MATEEPNEVNVQLERYKREITLYEKEAQKWEKKGDKIIKLYKDDRGESDKAVRYNILYSNTETLKSAVFNQVPQPWVERRFKDDDVLGRVTSDVLERCVSYFVKTQSFEDVMKQAVVDRLLPGRASAWVRYEPHFRDVEIQGSEKEQIDGVQVTDDEVTDDEVTQDVEYEEVIFDYVHFKDYGHNIARTYQEVWLQWRIAYLTKEENIARFGKKIGNEIPLDLKSKDYKDDSSDLPHIMGKSTIYELWDAKRKIVTWLHKDLGFALDEQPDPLRLPDFFPGAKPICANLANDTLIPTPDYIIYQDQANELNQLTARVAILVKALKVAGVYDASAEGIEKMLAQGMENKLVPVNVDAMMKEKGGLKNMIDYFPIEQVAKVLEGCYATREKVIQDIYQITGIADIIRGATNANETAAAQKIKGQFATLRLDDKQKEIQQFARDLVRIAAFVIAEHFQLDTIKKISGVRLFENPQEKMMYQQQAQKTQQPPDDKMQEMLMNPTWEEVGALLKDEPALCFKVDIETDSTIKADQEAEKEARTQFLTATSSFLKEMALIQDPKLKGFAGEMLMFGIRGFKAGRELEGQAQLYVDSLRKQSQQPQQEKPDPEAQKAQMENEQKEKDRQLETQKHGDEMAFQQKKHQDEMMFQTQKTQQEIQADKEKHAMTLNADLQKHAVKTQTDAAIKRESSAMKEETARQGIQKDQEMIKLTKGAQRGSNENILDELKENGLIDEIIVANAEASKAIIEPVVQVIAESAAIQAQPKNFIVERDAEGNMIAVRQVQ